MLLRHGRTRWNAERRFLGQTDLPLDALGFDEARGAAGWLTDVDAVYTSPLLRAVQTASFLPGVPRPVPALRELSQGVLEGLLAEEAFARFPSFFEAFRTDPERAAVPGGESLGDCRDRAIGGLWDVARAVSGGVAVVVTHQMVIASVACTVAGEPLARWRHHGIRNAAVTVLRQRGDRFEIALENARFDDP